MPCLPAGERRMNERNNEREVEQIKWTYRKDKICLFLFFSEKNVHSLLVLRYVRTLLGYKRYVCVFVCRMMCSDDDALDFQKSSFISLYISYCIIYHTYYIITMYILSSHIIINSCKYIAILFWYIWMNEEFLDHPSIQLWYHSSFHFFSCYINNTCVFIHFFLLSSVIFYITENLLWYTSLSL